MTPDPSAGVPPTESREQGQLRGSTVTLSVWAVLICLVIIGSLLPATSPLIAAVGRLHVSDKVWHFLAYVTLSVLPVIGFSSRKMGVLLGLSMFLLSLLLEGGQQFMPGRAIELGDMAANSAGVCFGTLLGLPLRTYLPDG